MNLWPSLSRRKPRPPAVSPASGVGRLLIRNYLALINNAIHHRPAHRHRLGHLPGLPLHQMAIPEKVNGGASINGWAIWWAAFWATMAIIGGWLMRELV